MRRRAAQRGFTLIELMVALLVSSLLVGMILAIFMRMSIAYRGQQQIAEVQNKLAAARAQIEIDAKHAGLAMSQGFTLMSTPSGEYQSPIRITNSSSGPDQIAFYYADTTVRAATLAASAATCDRMQCDALDGTAGFEVGDVVVSSTASTISSPYAAAGDANIATFQACVLQVVDKGPTRLAFASSGLWGSPSNSHCPLPVKGTTMYYKLVAHAWRIDPTRRALGVLQLSPTGDLVGGNDWQDQAYGFTDIQVATRFYEPGDLTDTRDPDSDPERDWYSDSAQETRTAPQASFLTPIQISISLVARTERDVEGIASSSTPSLTVADNTRNNTIGDRAAVALPSTSSDLSGNRVFRYTTFQVDLRNMGVGR
ncbi:MAG TPA: prepilin-type N-terminal cleavage/methylation domain-containing protein [Kofleriaceae bacterium]|nr:prepilin-type N-terminal cleavage/methylation domain-containing protein [Kofleriaceae bacterium]